jgi:hypothetical protein
MTTFDLDKGLALKHEGMGNAARRRKGMLDRVPGTLG